MNTREAAIRVLREAGGPLHSREITSRVLAGKLWKTSGKTPAATVEAALAVDIKKNGKPSVFVRVAPRTFGLRELGAKPMPKKSSTRSPRRKKGARKTTQTYSFTDAAENVLEQFGSKEPMHYRDITARALEMDWLVTEGKTPEASMYAQILMEIRRFKKRGEQPRFVQHGRGYVGLSRWAGRGLAFEIGQHNRRVRQALLKRLLRIEPSAFEDLIARLLTELGFEDVQVTRRTGDGGIDVRGTLVVGDVVRIRMAVQAKRWKSKNRVRAPTVQQVRGSLGTHEQGLIITTSDFSSGARQEAARADAVPVALMNGEELAKLLIEKDICVSRETHDIIELADVGEEVT